MQSRSLSMQIQAQVDPTLQSLNVRPCLHHSIKISGYIALYLCPQNLISTELFVTLTLGVSEILSVLEDVKSDFICSEIPGRFEWIDSVLVTAIRQGHWLLISHANFCRYDLCVVIVSMHTCL